MFDFATSIKIMRICKTVLQAKCEVHRLGAGEGRVLSKCNVGVFVKKSTTFVLQGITALVHKNKTSMISYNQYG